MINELNNNTSLDNQLKWELLKYEIRRLAIDEAERKYFENRLKNLDNILDNYGNLESYHNINEEGEKSSKFFLNLEKRRRIQGQIRKLIVNNQCIQYNLNMLAKTSEDCEGFVNKVSVPKSNYEDVRICEGDLNKFELLKALKTM